MADPNVRSESVNVVQIMERIRARIRETRGAEYTDAQIRELASATLQRYLDPRGIRPELVERLRQAQTHSPARELPNFEFEDETLFESTRPLLRWIRRLLLPLLKLFFNPNPLIRALNIQSRLNAGTAEREASRDATRYAFDQLHYEAMHNIVVEMTRLGVEMKNLRMQIESIAGRLEFTERRTRATEAAVAQMLPPPERAAVVEYRPEPPPQPRPAPAEAPRGEAHAAPVGQPATDHQPDGQTTRSRRRRRRRGRRGGAAPGGPASDSVVTTGSSNDAEAADREVGDHEADDRSGTDWTAEGDAVDGEAADGRTDRPEPLAHSFGAQAHQAEPTSDDRVSRNVQDGDTTAAAPVADTPPPTAES